MSVSASASWARPKSRSRASTPSPSASRTFAGLTSRWTIPSRVRVRERVRDLAGGLDGGAVVQLAGAQRAAQRLAGDVLVGDVDVLVVAGEAERALAVGMAELRGRPRLALGARSGLALARHDLERDLDAELGVVCEPDRAGAAAPERAQRPVAAEDELGRGEARRLRACLDTLCSGRRNSFRRQPTG